jgi:hypothetical protein
MTAPTSSPVPVPERIWFVDTNMDNFAQANRGPDDDSPFKHWLAARRMFVTPATKSEYDNNLKLMRPGEPVFAYEVGVGLVGLGWVSNPKDLADTVGGTALHAKVGLRIRSISVDWDPSVKLSTADMTKGGFSFTGHALRKYSRGSELQKPSRSRLYLEGILLEVEQRRVTDPDVIETAALKRIQTSKTYSPRTKAQVVQARLGQGVFRKAVLEREPACRVTGIALPPYLVASHIKPWAVCDDGEYLDSANGLMLAPHVDHLFDTGRISFTDDGDLLLAPAFDRAILRAWHIDENINVGPFAVDQVRYLAYHRHEVLGQPRPRRQRNLVGDASSSAADADGLQYATDAIVGGD